VTAVGSASEEETIPAADPVIQAEEPAEAVEE
jgi:hypothetical protein